MQAEGEYGAYMPKPTRGGSPARPRTGRRSGPRETIQYTVRDVPAQVDDLLRRKARESGLSLNQVLRDALFRESGADPGDIVHDDLDALAGTWVEDAAVDQALADQDRVDDALWK